MSTATRDRRLDQKPKLDPAHALTLLRSALDAASDQAIVVRDLDGRTVACNRAACRLYGREQAEALGDVPLHDPEVVPDDRLEQWLAQARSTGRWTGPLAGVRKDGTRFVAQTSIEVLSDASGQRLGYLWRANAQSEGAVIQPASRADRDEIAQLEGQIEQLQRASRKALSDLAHDLRTPLNGILGFAELMRSEPGGLSQVQTEYLADILESAKHMLELITSLRPR